ncbi:SGNH/GDSL hydrolase family protein [Alkalihalobacterium alkalinitrilicum]|uniref:SGNH/GDSL hydrolase family protein n=1 Tax=Alkalihalobacterium alkalinitrilicum TaxID=427920 RepID=UPI000995590A|nr:SGNH/GDSL hydrolase family protein [Alkalihalobacterium alkalinitrilicum]
MKNIIFVLSILLCVGLLVFGKIQYDQKLNEIAQDASTEKNIATSLQTSNQPVSNISHATDIESMEGLNPELKQKLMAAVENNQRLRVALFGSNAMAVEDDSETPWVDLLVQELNDTFGEHILDVTIFEVGNRTTHQVLEAGLHSEVVDFQPDVLIFEPLIFNDNGNATMNITLPNVTTILTDIEATSPDVFVVIQPPNPIYRPNYYLQQVNELKAYAEESGYTYLDHWEVWPDVTDEEINDYIEDSRPNQRGHEVWASAVIQFFTGKN